MVTSYITIVQYLKQNIDIGTMYTCHFTTLTDLCNRQCNQDTKLFTTTKIALMLSFYSHICYSVPCHCSPLLSINLFFISIILSFWECYINAIIQRVTFQGWPFFSHSAECPWDLCKLSYVSIVQSFLMLSSICGVKLLCFNHSPTEGLSE